MSSHGSNLYYLMPIFQIKTSLINWSQRFVGVDFTFLPDVEYDS